MSTLRSKILLEVSMWASRKRDGRIVTPVMLRDHEARLWRNGYYTAMNEVSQHFNMERLRAEEGE